LVYSLDTAPLFDPFDLDISVTPSSTLHVLQKEKDYLKALVMAFRLNEAALIRQVYEGIPHTDVALTVAELPIVYVPRLLRFVALQTEESPHLEFSLVWIRAIVDSHGQWIADNRGSVEAEMRTVSRAISKIRDELRRITDENVYMLDYLLHQPVEAPAKEAESSVLATDEAMGDDEAEGEWIGLE
jgi:periodic tryptophan protein 2